MLDLYTRRTCNHAYASGSTIQTFDLSTCPYCLSKGTVFDPIFMEDGTLRIIEGSDKLKQDVEKILIEEFRSSGYGFQFATLKGATLTQATITRLESATVSALKFLYNAQVDAEERGVFVSPDEKIDQIGDLSVSEREGEPRRYDVSVSLVTASAKDIELNITIFLEG